jgi:hypothetical protein
MSSFLAGYYWLQYSDILTRIGGALIYVNVGVDYGNGTRTFYNDTKTLSGATLFDVTKQVFNITYQVGIYGTEVISVNNISKQGSFGWLYWIWNATGKSWSIVWENVDQYRVASRETFMWFYHNDFNPPP